MGIFFRIANIGEKIYTVDEVRGILRASGYTSQEFVAEVSTGDSITAASLQQYQLPTDQRRLSDTVNALKGNPEHPPLYYLLARFCMQLFTSSTAARGLAALVGILTLLSMYWLCLELFQSADIAWIGAGLMAISPFHVLLASEARQYTLWGLLATGSSAFLLRALRSNRPGPWIGYGIAVTLGLYTHLFFVWVILSQGLYVLILEKLKLTQRVWRYLATLLLCGLAFAPWLAVILGNLDRLEKTTRWASQYNTGLFDRLAFWLTNIAMGFVDFNGAASLKNPVIYLVLGLVLSSIYLLCKHTPRQVWLFVLMLMGVTGLGQIVPDLMLGGRRSLLARYSLTSYIGLEMAVAFGIYHGWQRILQRDFSPYQQRFSKSGIVGKNLYAVHRCGTVLIVILGIVSSGLISQSLDWGKGSSSLNLAIAPIVNATPSPLVIGDEETFMLSLSYKVKPSVEFKLMARNPVGTNISFESSGPLTAEPDTFLYFPSNQLLEKVGDTWQLEPLLVGSPWFGQRPILYQIGSKG
ncbi:MAG: glycosyltransferase family 39 protein [Cyanobacteria bacterium P01_A01_bin.15]